ncbi:MAG: DNA translocase FtsK 4TM domain-containing protein [Archangium sp.]|nr:DNA translocase FtsK 4TM domain-containing protein [Archangium sp.]
MSAKRSKERSLLSRQEISARRKQLTTKKMASPGAPKRAIAGIGVLAVSVLSFLSVATFDAHDRIGPGFRNAVGPVGHAIAEALRGLFGVCAYALTLLGFYGAGMMFLGDTQKKRWSQVVAFALLLLSCTVLAQLIFKEDASWAHAPGGWIGHHLSNVLTGLFSMVGTVVLVSAVAAVAFIVGTEFAFLRLCSWLWDRAVVLAEKAKVWGLAFLEAQQERLEARREEAIKAKEEEATFLAQLEAEEAELAELEAAADEADAAADEMERLMREKENSKLADLTEKEKLKAEREKALVEREAARLAREALKTARVNEKTQRSATAAAMAPTLMSEARAASTMGGALAGDPAWAFSLAPQQPMPMMAPPPVAAQPSQPPPPAKRVPNIIEAPPPPPEESLPPMSPAAERTATAQLADSVPPGAPQLSPASTAAGALALARTPLIVEPKAPPKPTAVKKRNEFEFTGDRTSFQPPPVDLLEATRKERAAIDKDVYLQTAEKLTSKLRDFGIEGEVVEIRPGPVVTMYEFKPAPGVKVSRIASLSDDLAMAMEAMRVRIVAPIPGKGVVGIEVPNKDRDTVFLKEIAEQDAFQKSQSRLTMCLGKDIEGMPYIFDLAKAPHLLMAGTTGSGKSVAVNSMIMSILLKSTPEEVRFIMVDPKMLELSVYEGIPHLLLPVVTDPRKAATALQWAVDEMTRRYKLLSEAGVRNITGYNTYVEGELVKKKGPAAVAKPAGVPEPIIPPKAATAEAAAPTVEAAAPTPPVADEKPKKKRRMLIVDVADQTAPAAASAQTVEAAPSPAPELNLGVAAPSEPKEDPREAIPEDVQREVEALATEAEIRVDEAQLSESEEEAAALALASNVSAADDAKELKKLPYIVVIIDELADLMMVASKEVETSIARLAQMARAAGIHLMVATQRPSTDVVTGVIKANFPTRISFMLRSKPDSMTIIGTIGAEALLGMGDMLIMPPTSAHLQRVHGCFVSEGEIKKVVDHLKAQGKPVFDESILKPRDEENEGGGEEDELSDELYDQAVATVSEMRTVSISMLQRKMRIGYNRAARMIERMERDGMVGPADGAKPREVLLRPVGQMPGASAM